MDAPEWRSIRMELPEPPKPECDIRKNHPTKTVLCDDRDDGMGVKDE